MNQSTLKPAAGSRKGRKRLGRGPGSGLGKTSGRGEKGQKSRSGYSRKRGFEGGQMPLHRRLPKRGFHNLFRVEYRTINVDRLGVLEPGSTVDAVALQKAGLLAKGKAPLKVLGNGDLRVAVTVRAAKFTASAARKIEAAGGKAEVVAG